MAAPAQTAFELAWAAYCRLTLHDRAKFARLHDQARQEDTAVRRAGYKQAREQPKPHARPLDAVDVGCLDFDLKS